MNTQRHPKDRSVATSSVNALQVNVGLLVLATAALAIGVGSLPLINLPKGVRIALVTAPAVLLTYLLFRRPRYLESTVGKSGTAAVAITQIGLFGAAQYGIAVARSANGWRETASLVLIVMVIALALDAIRSTPGFKQAGMPLLAVLLFSLVMSIVAGSAAFPIDVLVFQEVGSDALARGVNPYAATYPDIYTPRVSELIYGPGISSEGYLTRGFPYFPASLLVVLPGFLLGDVRLVHAAAFAVSGILLWFIGGKTVEARRAAVLFLLMPGSVYMVGYGWTESLMAAALFAVLLFHQKKSRLGPYAFGFFVLLKQYTILFMPLYLLLCRSGQWRACILRIMKGMVPWLAVTALFLAWGSSEFIDAVVLWQFEQPFRPESISPITAAYSSFGLPPAVVVATLPLLVSGLAIAAVLRRAPRTLEAFSLSVAVVMVWFVIFSKQALFNYYFLVVAGVLGAMAAIGRKPVLDRDTGTSAVTTEPIDE